MQTNHLQIAQLLANNRQNLNANLQNAGSDIANLIAAGKDKELSKQEPVKQKVGWSELFAETPVKEQQLQPTPLPSGKLNLEDLKQSLINEGFTASDLRNFDKIVADKLALGKMTL